MNVRKGESRKTRFELEYMNLVLSMLAVEVSIRYTIGDRNVGYVIQSVGILFEDR